MRNDTLYSAATESKNALLKKILSGTQVDSKKTWTIRYEAPQNHVLQFFLLTFTKNIQALYKIKIDREILNNKYLTIMHAFSSYFQEMPPVDL